MSMLREKTGMKFGLPLSENMLKFGAVIIQTEAELLLKSRWVIPENLMSEGYEFKFPNLGNALDDLLQK
jgi:NAD dependent epimerase/dehydratase family enzyme